jgi:hypothetical protein
MTLTKQRLELKARPKWSSTSEWQEKAPVGPQQNWPGFYSGFHPGIEKAAKKARREDQKVDSSSVVPANRWDYDMAKPKTLLRITHATRRDYNELEIRGNPPTNFQLSGNEQVCWVTVAIKTVAKQVGFTGLGLRVIDRAH